MAEKTYFKKIILSTQIRLPNGKPIPWVKVGYNTGALETTDETLISELSKLATSGVGGIISITGEEFEELKKNSEKLQQKPVWSPRLTGPTEPLSTKQPEPSKSSPREPAVAVEKKGRRERSNSPSTATGIFGKE